MVGVAIAPTDFDLNIILEHCMKNEDFKYFSKVPLLLAEDYPHEYAIWVPFFCSNWRRTDHSV